MRNPGKLSKIKKVERAAQLIQTGSPEGVRELSTLLDTNDRGIRDIALETLFGTDDSLIISQTIQKICAYGLSLFLHRLPLLWERADAEQKALIISKLIEFIDNSTEKKHSSSRVTIACRFLLSLNYPALQLEVLARVPRINHRSQMDLCDELLASQNTEAVSIAHSCLSRLVRNAHFRPEAQAILAKYSLEDSVSSTTNARGAVRPELFITISRYLQSQNDPEWEKVLISGLMASPDYSLPIQLKTIVPGAPGALLEKIYFEVIERRPGLKSQFDCVHLLISSPEITDEFRQELDRLCPEKEPVRAGYADLVSVATDRRLGTLLSYLRNKEKQKRHPQYLAEILQMFTRAENRDLKMAIIATLPLLEQEMSQALGLSLLKNTHDLVLYMLIVEKLDWDRISLEDISRVVANLSSLSGDLLLEFLRHIKDREGLGDLLISVERTTRHEWVRDSVKTILLYRAKKQIE